MDNSVKVGSVAGTGAAINVQVGFIPSYVKVFNPNDAGSLFPTIERWKGMAAASGLKTKVIADNGATGNKSSDYVTSNGISDYAGAQGPIALSGTVSVTAGSATVTGSSTAFTTELAVGDIISINGEMKKVLAIASATSLTVRDITDGNGYFAATASGKPIFKVEGNKPGFTIGADTDINVAGETIFWIAVR